MNRELKAYLKNVLKKESFYIDVLSTILGVIIIVLTAVAFLGDAMGLLKTIFTLALLLVALNVFKGFRVGAPTRYIYAAFALILLGTCIYSYIKL